MAAGDPQPDLAKKVREIREVIAPRMAREGQMQEARLVLKLADDLAEKLSDAERKALEGPANGDEERMA